MTVGLLIALQLAYPALNLGLPFTSFGLLRPLHTNAVIFVRGERLHRGVLLDAAAAQGADVQRRPEQVPLRGWQLIIVAAVLTLPSDSRRPRNTRNSRADRHRDRGGLGGVCDQLLRDHRQTTERHLYVAIWFYIASDHHRRRPPHLQQPLDPRHSSKSY
ncbi:MAG: hypothetical protein R2882_08840 [Gemmatimonadales bacterium]